MIMRKNDAFVAKIINMRLAKIFMAIFAHDERLPSSATLIRCINSFTFCFAGKALRKLRGPKYPIQVKSLSGCIFNEVLPTFGEQEQLTPQIKTHIITFYDVRVVCFMSPKILTIFSRLSWIT